MEGFGIEKLSLVLVIVLVLFGARRIPEIGGSIGKGIREFKRGMSSINDDVSPAPSNTGAPSEFVDANAPEQRSEPKRLLSG